MTNDDNTDTYERWMGPVRYVVRRGGRVPLAPPLPGETEPFAWAAEPDEIVSIDYAGRPVESATATVGDDGGQLTIRFKDGDELVLSAGDVARA